MRVFRKQARGRFFDEEGVPLTNNQIDEFVNIAYQNIGVLFNAEGLRQEADGWFVGVDDNNPDLFHWFFSYKSTPYGKKLFAMGHDGSKEAKQELIRFKQEIMTNPNEHAYIEASGRVQQIMESWGVPKVPVEKVQEMLKGKNVTPMDEYAYKRELAGSGQVHTKTMYGYPKMASESPRSKEYIWVAYRGKAALAPRWKGYPLVHADLMYDNGFPFSGPEYDKVSKGYAEIDKAAKLIRVSDVANGTERHNSEGELAVCAYLQKRFPDYELRIRRNRDWRIYAAQTKPGDIPPIDLGEGYWLVRVHTSADEDTWEVLSDTDKLFRIGWVYIIYYPDLAFPSIDNIYVNEGHRHTGIGQRIIRALARFYGGLMSDPQGFTNSKARKMWQGVGGTPSPTDKNTKGWHWQFQSSLLKKAIVGYELTPEARELLLKTFPPKFPDVIAHHVTTSLRDKQLPPDATIVVEGYASDDSLEAVVVSVNGKVQRPDGGVYHITLSLDRSKGRRPKDSNVLLQNGWKKIPQPFDLQTHPAKIS